jgi:anaerobic selenocysteine-containing dehydrogenase
MNEQPSFCRICAAHCPILVEVEDGRPVRVRGDRDAGLFGGYTCAKGRALPQMHASPSRLLYSQKRLPDGTFEKISSEHALDEVATRLTDIVSEHGPAAVALYSGTAAFQSLQTTMLAGAWLKALGSSMSFSTGTIDQPGKLLAAALHGRWLAGAHDFDDSDTWMLIGTNPTVSKLGGIPVTNPARHLHQALKRGLQLIVIDPRRSEDARKARIHLQPRPGEDPTLIAGMIRLILEESLYDESFVAENARGLDSLRSAVEPYTPEYVSRRADVPADLLIEAARVFARARRGSAVAGTGPNMAPHGTLTEYLILCLNTLCGRWRRVGEPVRNSGVLVPTQPPRAQAAAPWPAFGFGPKLRVRGLTNTAAGLPTAALAEEILMEGPGRIRALVCVGGNPMMAIPDQLKADEAMRDLDLLVVVDPQLTPTARYADYVIAPRLMLETEGTTYQTESTSSIGISWGFPDPWAQYTPAVSEPPPDADVVDDWKVFYRLAQRMGLSLQVSCGSVIWRPGDPRPPRVPLNMEVEPSTEELIELLTHNSPVPLDEVRRHAHGSVFESTAHVAPRDDTCEDRLEFADPLMLQELAEVASESADFSDSEFPFRLVSRRIPDIMNSLGREIPALTRHGSYNPAFMHPEDLEMLGMNAGDVAVIRSPHASILGVVAEEAGIRRGAVSMPHGFGDAPGRDDDVRSLGSNTGRLTDCTQDYEPRSGIPRMSAIRVDIRPAS